MGRNFDVPRRKKNVLKKEDIDNSQKDLIIEKDAFGKCEKILYTTLMQFTKGDAKTKIISLGIHGVFEAYRYITSKGKNATVVSQMNRRMKVMNPEAAKSIKEVEGKINQWKMR